MNSLVRHNSLEGNGEYPQPRIGLQLVYRNHLRGYPLGRQAFGSANCIFFRIQQKVVVSVPITGGLTPFSQHVIPAAAMKGAPLVDAITKFTNIPGPGVLITMNVLNDSHGSGMQPRFMEVSL